MAREREPEVYPLLLFLADTDARLGEASALRWADVDLEAGTARIARSFSDGREMRPTKTRRERVVELSRRLRAELGAHKPDLCGADTLVFTAKRGGAISPSRLRRQAFRRVTERALGKGRDFTPHGLRHSFATLHLARGSALKWVRSMGGWTSPRILLDTYAHFLPAESSGYADAISGPGRPYTAPLDAGEERRERAVGEKAEQRQPLVGDDEGPETEPPGILRFLVARGGRVQSSPPSSWERRVAAATAS